MPWSLESLMKLREEFVLKALEPDRNMKALCREYGISRKTGYKWVARFRARGLEGLRDLSRRPRSSPIATSADIAVDVVALRRQHPRWGPKKLQAVLARSLSAEVVPSVRTVARILDRAGETRSRRKKRSAEATSSQAPAPQVAAANDLWTLDFKGWWLAADGARCEPFTVRDAYSRYVLAATLMEDTTAASVRAGLERLFEAHGMPRAILSDNGSPFGCTRARAGLTSLSAWLVSAGMQVLFSRPGCPQDNGGHERMHLDMRYDVEDESAATRADQQLCCDRWRHEFNEVRPHEALDMRVPAERYRSSPRRFRGSRPCAYPSHMLPRRVQSHGGANYLGDVFRVGKAFRGYSVGFEPVDDNTVQLWFYDVSLGHATLDSSGRQS